MRFSFRSLPYFLAIYSSIWFITLGVVKAQKVKPEPVIAQVDARPSPRPDRIILTWQTDPTTSQTVTWRTDNTVKRPIAEIALADASPIFAAFATTWAAKSEPLKSENGNALYHSVNFTGLKPNTLYAYRVGDGQYWSEWFHIKTANNQPEPFSFIYFGDAQTQLYSMWSRAIRAAYAEAPKAKFMIHAGDLINHAEDDTEWHEWFTAGSFITATIPSIPTPGNHEYAKLAGLPVLTKFWKPQFNLPDNGPLGGEDETYFIDYQDVRIISLNSMERVQAQAAWLENVLKNNPRKWTVITFHYPVFSSALGRENENLIKHWKPLFDKYKVDLVLQGHDHTYARGSNLPNGISVKDEKAGTVYVVSVSGPKMYNLTDHKWMERAAENTQLYQVITIDKDKLLYKSLMVTGELYDAFELTKRKNGINKLEEIKTEVDPERRYHNTLSLPK